MTTPATTEMVNQVGSLQEVEMNTKTGEATPLSSQNPADPSQTASPEGAPVEPANPAPEATPAPVTSAPVVSTPAPETPAAVTVETAAPAPAPAAPASTQPEATPGNEPASLESLATLIKGQREEAAEETRRTVQSQFDRQNTQVAQKLQESKTTQQELTQKIRELETRELSEAERAKVMETYAQQDERAELNNYRNELLQFNGTVVVDSLMLQYGKYEGVTPEALGAIETPEEQELYCEQKRSAALEKQLEESKTAPVAPTAVAPETPAPVAEPVASVAAVPNAPGVPAGATAPSDIGTGGASVGEKKFSEEASGAAMQQNLRNLDWSRVNISQGN